MSERYRGIGALSIEDSLDLSGWLTKIYLFSCVKAILSQEEVVPVYAHYWERYNIASGFLNLACDYLNGLIVRQRKGPGATDKRPFVGQSKYPRQDIQAVKIHWWDDDYAPTVLCHGCELYKLTMQLFLLLYSSQIRSGESMSSWRSNIASRTDLCTRFSIRSFRTEKESRSTTPLFRAQFFHLVRLYMHD